MAPVLNVHAVTGEFKDLAALKAFLSARVKSLPAGESHVFLLSENAFGTTIPSDVLKPSRHWRASAGFSQPTAT